MCESVCTRLCAHTCVSARAFDTHTRTQSQTSHAHTLYETLVYTHIYIQTLTCLHVKESVGACALIAALHTCPSYMDTSVLSRPVTRTRTHAHIRNARKHTQTHDTHTYITQYNQHTQHTCTSKKVSVRVRWFPHSIHLM